MLYFSWLLYHLDPQYPNNRQPKRYYTQTSLNRHETNKTGDSAGSRLTSLVNQIIIIIVITTRRRRTKRRKRQQAKVEGETGEHQESSKEKNNKSNEKESERQPLLEKTGESDKELKSIFIQKLKLRRSNMEEIQP